MHSPFDWMGFPWNMLFDFGFGLLAAFLFVLVAANIWDRIRRY